MNPLTRMLALLINPPYPFEAPPMLTQTAKLVHGAFLPRDSKTDNRFAWRKKFYQRKASLALNKPTTQQPNCHNEPTQTSPHPAHSNPA